MPGQPMQTMFEKLLEEQGGLEAVLGQFRDGMRTGQVAAHYGVSREWLTNWLRHDDRRAAYLEARKIGGTALMEDAADLCDNVEPERDKIMKARLQFESRKVLAGAFDPETFGEKGGDVTVTVNSASLHIDALRRRVVEATRPPAELMRQPPATLPAGLTEVDVTDASTGDPAPPLPAERHGVDGNADAGTLWCHDCGRNDCRHVKYEYARQAQHYADTHAPRELAPRSRGIV